jgi:hypothetical protein
MPFLKFKKKKEEPKQEKEVKIVRAPVRDLSIDGIANIIDSDEKILKLPNEAREAIKMYFWYASSSLTTYTDPEKERELANGANEDFNKNNYMGACMKYAEAARAALLNRKNIDGIEPKERFKSYLEKMLEIRNKANISTCFTQTLEPLIANLDGTFEAAQSVYKTIDELMKAEKKVEEEKKAKAQ